MRFLFIGNSATHVHSIPQQFCRLAGEAGFHFETAQITPDGFELAAHADAATEHGQQVLVEIKKGYDIVFLQENGSCIRNEEKRRTCEEASAKLIDAILKSGAAPWFYVRPPYGKTLAGFTPLQQCEKFDRLFCKMAADHPPTRCVPVHRAFAYAIEHLPYPLWGADNAHTSEYGAYLIVCTFFAAVFGESSARLGNGGLEPAAAAALADAADRAAGVS